MVFAGGPDEVADGIVRLHRLLGHSRQILQMDVGGMPHATFLKSIALLGTKVLPRIRAATGATAAARRPTPARE
jgi:alkanesulfonate monooxygenase SsuD/methylene tetrahydromethanopterin reductase-like flavin-dependent oxidoreductase (luciferase family)